LGCKRSRGQIPAARPNTSKTYGLSTPSPMQLWSPTGVQTRPSTVEHPTTGRSARVDENTLSAALDRAGLIFQDAGIKLTWLQCSAGSAQMVNFPVTLALRIIREPASGFVSRNALGFAVAAQGGAVYAAVFRNPLLAMSSGALLGSGAPGARHCARTRTSATRYFGTLTLRPDGRALARRRPRSRLIRFAAILARRSRTHARRGSPTRPLGQCSSNCKTRRAWRT
jgi:hypothetical protein